MVLLGALGLLLLLAPNFGAAVPPFGTVCHPAELAAPPRGWNSYDSSPPWTNISMASTEAKTMQDASVLSFRLLPHGYDMLTLDSGWFGVDGDYGTQSIDKYGRLVPNSTQFPSAKGGVGFRALADKVHDYGLKFGVWIMGGIPRMAVEAKARIKGTKYTAADIAITDGPPNKEGKATGSMDCPWNRFLVHGINMSHPGAMPYIYSLAELYADWRLDMLKVDCVFGADWYRGEAYIRALVQAIQSVRRPMIISLSPGMNTPNKTLAEAAVQISKQFNQTMMARMTNDFWDNWPALAIHFTSAANLAQYATSIFSPDLDMLPMGLISHVGGPHYSKLTKQEQRSMMSLWVMARAPLIWGGDPVLSNSSTFDLLSNSAVLDVQTNSCRNQLIESASTNLTLVWGAQNAQAPGGRFLAMFNIGGEAATVSVPWTALGLAQRPAHVSELWKRGELLRCDDMRLHARLEPHDAVLVDVLIN